MMKEETEIEEMERKNRTTRNSPDLLPKGRKIKEISEKKEKKGINPRKTSRGSREKGKNPY